MSVEENARCIAHPVAQPFENLDDLTLPIPKAPQNSQGKLVSAELFFPILGAVVEPTYPERTEEHPRTSRCP